ncbi:MarR family winged helix-turn-helix transcriptional regulator [Arthrobacter sp. NPDC056727]|uniref:MarR family winged helix-turn-helix transcriptional regulator n=1 Tax=Arthrobacter sp. NPDC056727 TaxID=3345927 RepID=UPI0036726A9F
MVPNPDADQWGPHQLLSMAARLVQRRQDQALAELGLTHAAVIALQGLLEGPLNQEQLAADIKVRSQSIGRVLSRLEGAGLVSRASSSVDRRHNEVSITAAGRQALEAARKAEQEALPPDVVGGTVLGRELARVISYFPGRAKGGSDKPHGSPAAGDTADAGVAAQGTAFVAGVPSEGVKAEGAQQVSSTDTAADPAMPAPVTADEAAQDTVPAPQDHSGQRQKPGGKKGSGAE